jgi:hypothetical protein
VPRATTPLQYRLELIEGRAVSGRYRLEAAKQLGWKQIRANTYGEMTDDAAIQKLALKMVSHAEFTQRTPLPDKCLCGRSDLRERQHADSHKK